MLAEERGPSFPSVVAILPNFDGFLPILSKLKYLYGCNRLPTYRMSKITLCLPPARLGPREADSQCSGNISSFSMDFSPFNQNSTIHTDLIIIRHLQYPNKPPVSHVLAEDSGRPWFPVWWQYCQISMDFFHFHQNWIISIDLAVIRPFQWSFNPLSPTYSVRPRALDSQCSGNIATFRWISSNFM